jgi:Secretion system C-terminal sorting domain
MKYFVSLLIGVLFSDIGLAQVLGPVIYQCDFSNGIPSDWTTGSATGISQWEYRGPNTTPDVSVGARGTCAALAVPISSETQSNGFIIFDSNYWDDGGTICGGLGTGVDPAPHNAYVAMPSQNFTSFDGVILTFQQQYRHFLDSTIVEVSLNNGSSWTTVFMNQESQSSSVEWVNVNLSSIAAGQSNVLIRFHYTGLYYWWLIDDITLYEPNNNDLRLNSAKYTTNGGINSAFPYNDLEYDQYPSAMIPSFVFSSNVSNIGAFDQTNSYLNVKIVKDGLDQIYNQNSPQTNILSGTAVNLAIAAPYLQNNILGDYDLFFEVDQDEADEFVGNNFDTLNYSITPYSYARDEGACQSLFDGLELFEGYRFEAGNYFQARSFGRVIHGVSVAIGEGTQLGAPIKAVIYKDGFEEIWGESEVHYVNYAEINQIGDEKIVVLPLIDPITTFNDSLYVAMVGNVNSDDDFVICRSGVSPEATSILRYPDANSMLYFLNTPVVRLNIFNSNAIPGCNKPDAANYDATATIEDGTCLYPGCAHADADNYDPNANWDDGSCIIGGCLDVLADNYHPYATYDNQQCQYLGCNDPAANNYDPTSNTNDGSCVYINAYFQVDVVQGCAPLSIMVTNQTILQENSICSYNINDEVVSEECLDNFVYLFTEPGVYTITYTHESGEFFSSYSLDIEVLAAPVTPVLINETPLLTCLNCGLESIQWFINENEINNANGINLNIMSDSIVNNGVYHVELTNDFGCISQSNSVTVFQAQLFADAISGCSPLGVNFSNATMEISDLVCSIDFGDLTGLNLFEGEIQHVYALPGDYSAVLTCQDGSNESVALIEITSGAPTDIDVYWNNVTTQVVCSNPNEFETITWYIGNNEYVGPGPFIDEVGTWTVVGVTPEGCVSSDEVVVTSLDESNVGDLLLYPNPSRGLVQLHLPTGKPVDLFLYNVLGELVWQAKATQPGTQNLDWSALCSGVYQLVLSDQTLVKCLEVVIQKD